MIQPELTIPGIAPIPNEFSAFQHLTQGLGPDADGNIWGPLDPFPQSGVKVFDISTCPPVTKSPTGTDPGTGTTPTTAAGTSPTAVTSPTASPAVDTVKVSSATWANTGGGTLTVTCTSTNKNSAQVGMTLDYLIGTTNRFNLAMTASTTTPGTWTFTGPKIKQPSRVTCKSKAGGSASAPVTARRRRSMRIDARNVDVDEVFEGYAT